MSDLQIGLLLGFVAGGIVGIIGMALMAMASGNTEGE